jgi:hypothetical protein
MTKASIARPLAPASKHRKLGLAAHEPVARDVVGHRGNSQGDALALLPRYVAARTAALPASEVAIP